MNADQARMARAAIQKGVREIAELAGVTPNTVSRIENGGDAKVSTVQALRAVYASFGVEFREHEDGSICVCFDITKAEATAS